MRLLQLATGPDELLDLHPHVTVVTGLSDDERATLASAVTGLARGRVSGTRGLLEAQGVMFDMSDEMLALLDLDVGELQPVVRQGDLPTRRAVSPMVQDLLEKEEALADLAARWSAANEASTLASEALRSATAAVEQARLAEASAGPDAARRIGALAALTEKAASASERRSELDEALAEHLPIQLAATAQREEVDAATSAVRAAKQAAAARAADLAAALDRSAMARPARSGPDVATARAALRDLEAVVDAERAIEAQDRDSQVTPPTGEELEAARATAAARRDELEQALVAFESVMIGEVERALGDARAATTADPVASPAAVALAEELDAVDMELGGLPDDDDESSSRLIDARARLDAAGEALGEAEQAVRSPALDRDLVDRLEVAHADVLNAIEKSDNRFGGERAKRRAEELRSVEHWLLDELGFTSYSDFMMGNSLLHVDPKKERALDAARDELRAAEDAWRILQDQTEAELVRAARLDYRRGLREQAQQLLGRPVGASGAAEALRSIRVERTPTIDPSGPLRKALEAGGLALGDEDLDLEDLTAIADAWLEQAGEAATRDAAVRAEMAALDAELAGIADAMVSRQIMDAAAPVQDPEIDRQARLAAAADALAAAEVALLSQQAAEQDIQSLTEALANAAEQERIADAGAVDGEQAMAEALAAEATLVAEQRRLEDELATAARAEADAQEELRAMAALEPISSEALAEATAEAERTLAARSAEAGAAASTLAELLAERETATLAADALRASIDQADDGREVSIGEEAEWYLLARLAAQRSVSLAGSIPLLIDDALRGLEDGELQHVLDRLERMAEAVQVIVVSEDPLVTAWALDAGEDRAAVVRSIAG